VEKVKPLAYTRKGKPIYPIWGAQEATQTQVVEGAQPTGAQMIPFRRATTYRTQRLPAQSGTSIGATEQVVQLQVEGAGYLSAIDLAVDIETAANAAAVTYHEDAPWNALTSVVLQDVNGELVNLSGFNLFLANLAGGWKRLLDSTATDTQVFEQLAGAVGRGGSVRFHLKVPASINWRNLIGLLGNQDRAQKYVIRSNINTTGNIYIVTPTTPGAVTVERTYENFAVPNATNSQGIPQEMQPPKFGVLHYLTQSTNPGAAPVASSTQNHYLPRIGNTIRFLVLVFRDGNGNAARADAEANPPSLIKFSLGDTTTLFSEDWSFRKTMMFHRWGFQWPNGVLVYDWITDIVSRAGDELGDDYLFTNGLTNAQFEITYPAGWAANSSLVVITDDLVVPKGMDLYS
jgi:hypothetical protein